MAHQLSGQKGKKRRKTWSGRNERNDPPPLREAEQENWERRQRLKEGAWDNLGRGRTIDTRTHVRAVPKEAWSPKGEKEHDPLY